MAVQNGGNDGKGSERGLEYDTMSDRYARFIHHEVLPAVVSNFDDQGGVSEPHVHRGSAGARDVGLQLRRRPPR